jgi:putative addiction module CopG family antidote
MAAIVEAKVASGDYATESEVIRDGLRTLQARDAALDNWLRGEVAKSYDEFAADPSSGIPAGALRPNVLRKPHCQAPSERWDVSRTAKTQRSSAHQTNS